MPASVGLGVLLGVLLLAPAAALADPPQAILHTVALKDPALDPALVLEQPVAVLNDAALSGIRGRGTEGLAASAAGAHDIAVILWDEQNRRRPQSQQGSGISHSVGFGNGQVNSLVTRRY